MIPRWSIGAERVAQRQVSQGLPAESQLDEIECRSTMCRAVVSHENVGAYRGYVEGMLRNPHREWTGPAMYTLVDTAPNGRVRTEVFFTKDENPVANNSQDTEASSP